jgi:hypothetical protein
MSVTNSIAINNRQASFTTGFTFIVIWFKIVAYSFQAFQLPPFYRYINR